MLVVKNDHLLGNRRMILAHAVAASAAGLLPLPIVDEWVEATILRSAVTRIAESRGVDLDENAKRILAIGTSSGPSWSATFVRAARLSRMMRRTVRRVLLVLAIGRRAEYASRAFAACTLFDHYCARLHVGPGLDEEGARRVRLLIDRALQDLPRGVLPRLFLKGLLASGKAIARLPLELAERIRRLAAKKPPATEAEAAAEIDAAVDDRGPAFGRLLRSVELELGAAGRAYVDDLVARLEKSFAT